MPQYVYSILMISPWDSELPLEELCKQKNSSQQPLLYSIKQIQESIQEQKMIDSVYFLNNKYRHKERNSKAEVLESVKYLYDVNNQIYIQNCISNLMNKVTIIVLLLSAAYSLTIGSLSCCPQTYVYDEDTLTCVCPSNRPFISSKGQCVNCAAPKRWDQQSKTCYNCRVGQTENANGMCECPRDNPFDDGKQCVPCPDDLPIWNGYKCVACPTGTYYDIGSKTCTVCPQGLVYVSSARKCQIKQ